LTAIVNKSPASRIFYASSSLIFSGENGKCQDENTLFTPQGIYGLTKAQAIWICREFRKKYGIFASTGILYNHESHFRKPSFLTAKIIDTAIRISKGSTEKLEIGNMSASVDWGYAKDYVRAFQLILKIDIPDDFIIASGESHTVREFIDIVFEYLNLDPNAFLNEDRKILARSPAIKVGNPGKLNKATGWAPTLSFKDFVIQLLNDRLKNKSYEY
jgi:GDPmannose 4,6-dehydratase